MLYQPAGKGPFPAIVVIHEWWGLNDWMKEEASKFADQGYVTLAMELYTAERWRRLPRKPTKSCGESRKTAPIEGLARRLSLSASLKNVKPTKSVPLDGVWAEAMRSTSLLRSEAGGRAINYGHLASETAYVEEN